MNLTLRKDADAIIAASLKAVLPDEAVRRALQSFQPKSGRVLLAATGKAAWQMAHAAVEALGSVDGGVVVTKYDHVKGEIPGVDCYEAGHPVPDDNNFAATEKVLELVQGLTEEDTVLFLLSGGGSALFEKPLLPGGELQDITSQLLASGADIVEMNTIRKRLSGVKGGRFAQACAPAQVFSIVLSDILGDPLDMIASGPAVLDTSTCEQAQAIAEKYYIGVENLRKMVAGYAAQTGLAKPIERPKSGVQQKNHPEENAKKSQKLLITWITDEPSIYQKIKKYISPGDFTEELYRKVAEKLFAGLEEGNFQPAGIISTFEDEEEQRQAAELFQTNLPMLETGQEREKAFHDILLSVKRNSYEYYTARLGTDMGALEQVIAGKKALEELAKAHISLE